MRRGGKHGRGPVLLALAIVPVKSFHAQSEALRFAADFVQRGQPVVDVKSGILQPLGHDRPGCLLEFQDEMDVLFAGFVVEVFRETEEQDVAQEIEDRFFERRVAPLGRSDRALDHGAIGFAHRAARREVGSINRKTGDCLAHRKGQGIEGIIAVPAIFLRDPVEHRAEDIDVVGEREPHDEALLGIDEMSEMQGVPNEFVERVRDRALGRGVDQHADGVVHEIIASRAVNWPVFRKLLVAAQDFLDHEIDGAGRCSRGR